MDSQEQSASAQAASGSATSGGECTAAALAEAASTPGFDTVHYCNGTWAQGGSAQAEQADSFHFDGTTWQRIPAVGKTQDGTDQPCYDVAALRRQGAPEEVLGGMAACS